GELSPWVEIHNGGEESANLQGFYLTDDPDNLTKWQIPDKAIGPDRYGLIFLSGSGFSSLFDQEIHSGFKLSRKDDYLALVAADGETVVDFYEGFSRSPLGLSFGRVGIDEDEKAFFQESTPWVANRSPYDGVVADTKFTVDRGFFTDPFDLEITTATEGARIYYSTSGKEPGPGTLFTGPVEQLYTGPIRISETTALRAVAHKDGFAPSNIDTQTYIFPSDVITQPEMDRAITESSAYKAEMEPSLQALPSISLVMERPERDMSNEREDPASVEWLNPDGTKGFQIDAGITRFGGYFTDFPKKQFRLYFRTRYGKSKLEYPLFRGFENGVAPAESFDAINLRSGSHDMAARGAYLSNRFADDTLLEMGHVAPHGRFVHVYLNGLYWGQYHLRERWGAAMFASYFPGDKEDYEAINGNNTGMEFLPGVPFDGDGDFWEEALELGKSPTPYESLQTHIDLTNFIDFMLVWLSGNSESEFQSVGSREKAIPFKFYLKDADGYLRTIRNRLANDGPGGLMGALRNEGHPDFEMLLSDRIQKHYFAGGALTEDRTITRLKRRIRETERPFYSEAARWGFRDPESWRTFQDSLIESHLPRLTDLMVTLYQRDEWFPSNITAPVFEPMGGHVERGAVFVMETGSLFTPQPGELRYTIDGTDPRLPGGGLAGSSFVYERGSPGLIIDRPLIIRARLLDPDGQWSPLTEASFAVGQAPEPGELLVTEIHYRPEQPTRAERKAGFLEGNEFEFLELHNAGPVEISLSGLRLSEGVRFDFDHGSITSLQSGELGLLVNNRKAFEKRYGNQWPVIGEFESGNLSNGGENLRFLRDDGSILLDQPYNDRAPWPEAADGEGFSLTLTDTTGRKMPSEGGSWSASKEIGGSPGRLEIKNDPFADRDGDGLSSLLETALGSSDNDPTSGPRHFQVEKATIDVDGLSGSYWVFSVRHAEGIDASRFSLQGSNDLVEWLEETTFVRKEAGNGRFQWRSLNPATESARRRFLRILVVE
ncbi:MAG: chitobiase/beta-hexosaminidase C-terminal domain-containing protein, partial [Verrucomicrobiota bacterium]